MQYVLYVLHYISRRLHLYCTLVPGARGAVKQHFGPDLATPRSTTRTVEIQVSSRSTEAPRARTTRASVSKPSGLTSRRSLCGMALAWPLSPPSRAPAALTVPTVPGTCGALVVPWDWIVACYIVQAMAVVQVAQTQFLLVVSPGKATMQL